MLDQLRELQVDVLATQEGLTEQLEDLTSPLGFERVGQGRLGGDAGEHTAILFNPRRFTLLETGDLWFSGQPQLPGSIHPDAQLPRMLTWARLLSTDTGCEILIVNTHLSHVSDRARQHSVEQIIALLASFPPELAIIVAGDFNDVTDSDLFELLTRRALLRDSAAVAPVAIHANVATFTGFQEPQEGKRIDWLLVNDRVEVRGWQAALPPAKRPPPSDHLPILVDAYLLGGTPPQPCSAHRA